MGRKRLAILILCLAALGAGCGGDDERPAAATDKAIVAFSFPGPGVPGDIDEAAHAVGAAVTFDTDRSALVAVIEHTGVAIEPPSGEAQDFRQPVTYTVTAADGSTQAYVATVRLGAAVTTAAVVGDLTCTVQLTGTSALCGGAVTNEGLSPVTARGLCWNATGNPTLADSTAAAGAGTGAFANVVLHDLAPNTTCYARAYATNDQGTAYGNVVSFDTGWPLGTDHAGGWVFYNDGAGGGLVCGKADLRLWPWSNVIIAYAGVVRLAIGTGLPNSLAIVAQAGHVMSAAMDCLDYSDGTYDDWFLPSSDELRQIHLNLRAQGLGNLGETGAYWSSTELAANQGVYLGGDGVMRVDLKGQLHASRPVRVF